jgi:hypothetical protein
MNGAAEIIEDSGAAPSLPDDKEIKVDDNAADPDKPAAAEGGENDDQDKE